MPPRKAAKRDDAGQFIEREAEEDESASSGSSTEGEAQMTVQDEEDEEDNDDTVQSVGTKRRRRTAEGNTKAQMKKWRRLAVEEKEAIVNEGGMVWRAARPLLASLSTKQRKEATDTLRSILDSVEMKLDKELVPRTTSMPHATRNLTGAMSSSGSILGSVMSWQLERGARIIEDEEEDSDDEEKGGQVSVLEMGGFSSDIALLESLLLPEATETVTLNRAVEEQEKQLETTKAQLIELKADRERRTKQLSSKPGSEVSADE